MYFTSVTRFSPEHGRMLHYYKIKESFRDVLGRVHTRVMLTPWQPARFVLRRNRANQARADLSDGAEEHYH